MKRGGNILHNCFDKIKLEKSPCGLYYFLVLENLEFGVYQLRYNMWAGQKYEVKIRVNQG